jgi:DNA-binding CsgD family transcriptional regulator
VTAPVPETEWQKLRPTLLGDLQLAAVHVHDAVMRSGLLMTPLAHPLLSAREREVLQWMAAGKSRQDVGDILGISARTVAVHPRSAREKLGVLTVVQAVGRAISLKIIFPRQIGPKAA